MEMKREGGSVERKSVIEIEECHPAWDLNRPMWEGRRAIREVGVYGWKQEKSIRPLSFRILWLK